MFDHLWVTFSRIRCNAFHMHTFSLSGAPLPRLSARANCCASSARTGTVDFSTTILLFVAARAIVRPAPSHLFGFICFELSPLLFVFLILCVFLSSSCLPPERRLCATGAEGIRLHQISHHEQSTKLSRFEMHEQTDLIEL